MIIDPNKVALILERHFLLLARCPDPRILMEPHFSRQIDFYLYFTTYLSIQSDWNLNICPLFLKFLSFLLRRRIPILKALSFYGFSLKLSVSTALGIIHPYSSRLSGCSWAFNNAINLADRNVMEPSRGELSAGVANK